MMIEDQAKYIKANLNKPVVIIGMMGAGKTTLGRKIAEILQWPFFDSDLEIEKEEKISIKEMFEANGESFFRRKEKDKIAGLLKNEESVISVGGGAVTHPDTAHSIFFKSLCLWLDAPIVVLAGRTAHQGSRPLLNGRNIEEALAERMEQRKGLYEQAHLHIEGSKPVNDVAHNAIGQIYNYLLQK